MRASRLTVRPPPAPAASHAVQVINGVKDSLSLESISRVFDAISQVLADATTSASVCSLLLHLLFK